ncbi:MAG TPA: SDR family NAD(P)-dependent oxidoreductase [Geminicoccus sp.]|jgi:NAD(P)-dependent dehydrogenase (short-subunit alcohol dehydrogenase family)|uniref:SDR family NAD(P)-dependent oxidoreductase n=1 Tax=Geminicoccus sp. TaxID=2024832 RepID=UPI002E37EDED|nr:SDR family NAD(P)-dependent oxidoreductase [Geminicoccus sp.]HEX2527234.1 SDR family NAD(P)-dependent oxidoreductase [Geminicoccus sp.]
MFADDVIIVTGAGGNLGAACTALLASRGALMVAVDRTQETLDKVLGDLDSPGRHLGVAGVDLTDAAACARLVEQARQRFGRIDGLVNTVGTFAMAGIEEADAAQWDLMFKVNLTTALNMCRAVVPVMRSAGRGSIVNIGSIPAPKAPKALAAYAASKSAVLRLTESLADELKGQGIRANTALPSTIDTPQNRAMMPKADPAKWVTPVQLAEVIAFLVSAAASGVTGAAVPVTGRG